jgi:hypothetical protein
MNLIKIDPMNVFCTRQIASGGGGVLPALLAAFFPEKKVTTSPLFSQTRDRFGLPPGPNLWR